MDLSSCISELVMLYEKDVKIKEGPVEDDKIALLPDELKEFYSVYQSMKLPFGEVYPIGECIESSKIGPLKEEGWFCFGQDSYSTVWLCKATPDKDGLSFATWDMDWEDDEDDEDDEEGESEEKGIAEAAFDNMGDFLKFLSDEYMESELAVQCSVFVSGYSREAMKEVLEVKKAFHSPISMLELKEKASKGSCMVKEQFHYYQAKRILRELNLQSVKVTLKKKRSWF